MGLPFALACLAFSPTEASLVDTVSAILVTRDPRVYPIHRPLIVIPLPGANWNLIAVVCPSYPSAGGLPHEPWQRHHEADIHSKGSYRWQT